MGFRRRRRFALTAGVIFLIPGMARAAPDLSLWYDRPAKPGMNEPLPVGNGRIGAMQTGGVDDDALALNVDSLWTGDANPSGDYGKMGAYQPLGTLALHLDGTGEPTDYRRSLDLRSATAEVAYARGDVRFRRQLFVSHPDQVIALRLTADRPGQITGTVALTDDHKTATTATGTELRFAGSLANGLRYDAQLRVVADGGTVAVDGTSLRLTGCNAVTILVAAGTDYLPDAARHFRGPDPTPADRATLAAAAAVPFDPLLARHVADYRALFDRVSLTLPPPADDRASLPTDRRKVVPGPDPTLEALLFQYGRYLLIASSRDPGLPANLQGLWNDSDKPPWSSDYHTNINVQMNYWPAGPGNLPECERPFFRLVESQLPAWRTATAADRSWRPLRDTYADPAAPGFALRTSHNIFGGMGWNWDRTADAWYARMFFDHYAFTGDIAFLKGTAYPLMAEVSRFWLDRLKDDGHGHLVVPHAWSPEHGPVEDGVSYAQQIIWDLLDNTAAAAAVLRVDGPFRHDLLAARDRLLSPAVGSWGQLLEWATEKHDKVLDTPNDHHRHTSHLFAVYPGHQIDPATTPALAKAAAVSLRARGNTGDVREWSFAWRTALYARLGDGDAAEGQLRQLLAARNSCPNLFGLHPPMQIDGNFGATGAVCEMLVQSQTGTIKLLPALPACWPDGTATGLCARGGFTVDLAWRGGRLTAATVHSARGGPCVLSADVPLDHDHLSTVARDTYTVRPK